MLDWVNLLIVATLLFYLFDGYRRGIVNLTIELLGFFVAIFIAFKNYAVVGTWVTQTLNLSTTFINSIGFLTVWLTVEFIFYFIGLIITLLLPNAVKRSKIEHYLGVIPSAVKGSLLLAVAFSLVLALPIKSKVKQDILENPLANMLVKRVTFVEAIAQETFGQSLDNTLTYLLSKPQDYGDAVVLNFHTDRSIVDEESEKKMLSLVNKEREKAGLNSLAMDDKLREAARLHSRDMFEKGYFAHINQDGEDPFERMQELNIIYSIAGENLAFAPNVEIAHVGLMNSPKHRDNILLGQFTKVGIGVVDAGIYGKMFSQEFSD